jgi:hypothetical protein
MLTAKLTIALSVLGAGGAGGATTVTAFARPLVGKVLQIAAQGAWSVAGYPYVIPASGIVKAIPYR